MGSISHHIRPLVITSFRGRHTHTHTHTLRRQDQFLETRHTDLWPVHSWFKNLILQRSLKIRGALVSQPPFNSCHLQLNSNSKYNIPLKAPPVLMCIKIQHSRTCLETNTALGQPCAVFPYLSTCPLVLYLPYTLVVVFQVIFMVYHTVSLSAMHFM